MPVLQTPHSSVTHGRNRQQREHAPSQKTLARVYSTPKRGCTVRSPLKDAFDEYVAGAVAVTIQAHAALLAPVRLCTAQVRLDLATVTTRLARVLLGNFAHDRARHLRNVMEALAERVVAQVQHLPRRLAANAPVFGARRLVLLAHGSGPKHGNQDLGPTLCQESGRLPVQLVHYVLDAGHDLGCLFPVRPPNTARWPSHVRQANVLVTHEKQPVHAVGRGVAKFVARPIWAVGRLKGTHTRVQGHHTLRPLPLGLGLAGAHGDEPEAAKVVDLKNRVLGVSYQGLSPAVEGDAFTP